MKKQKCCSNNSPLRFPLLLHRVKTALRPLHGGISSPSSPAVRATNRRLPCLPLAPPPVPCSRARLPSRAPARVSGPSSSREPRLRTVELSRAASPRRLRVLPLPPKPPPSTRSHAPTRCPPPPPPSTAPGPPPPPRSSSARPLQRCSSPPAASLCRASGSPRAPLSVAERAAPPLVPSSPQRRSSACQRQARIRAAPPRASARPGSAPPPASARRGRAQKHRWPQRVRRIA
ncbi:hypothetical protein PR202_ga00756 [Eleusine coracana subsp. coracana]|uniref:Uncharacterized protein n=1 Tax=Eleusine coracana subsp. coracana TaxID=191504 RepID=A0AAV5BHB9_ELECO|nr:hypothetical protein PR202_ga00756 [Eleusine coracana subsp. coracana]